MVLKYRQYNSQEFPGKWHEFTIEGLSPEAAVYTAFSKLADGTAESPIPEVEIYGANSKLAFIARANEYSDGEKEYILTPQKEEE